MANPKSCLGGNEFRRRRKSPTLPAEADECVTEVEHVRLEAMRRANQSYASSYERCENIPACG